MYGNKVTIPVKYTNINKLIITYINIRGEEIIGEGKVITRVYKREKSSYCLYIPLTAAVQPKYI